MITKEQFNDIILEDDNSPFGGVSYQGQTLADFLEEVNMDNVTDINVINNALSECGIKPIKIK
jgi:hypothetical protein